MFLTHWFLISQKSPKYNISKSFLKLGCESFYTSQGTWKMCNIIPRLLAIIWSIYREIENLWVMTRFLSSKCPANKCLLIVCMSAYVSSPFCNVCWLRDMMVAAKTTLREQLSRAVARSPNRQSHHHSIHKIIAFQDRIPKDFCDTYLQIYLQLPDFLFEFCIFSFFCIWMFVL